MLNVNRMIWIVIGIFFGIPTVLFIAFILYLYFFDKPYLSTALPKVCTAEQINKATRLEKDINYMSYIISTSSADFNKYVENKTPYGGESLELFRARVLKDDSTFLTRQYNAKISGVPTKITIEEFYNKVKESYDKKYQNYITKYDESIEKKEKALKKMEDMKSILQQNLYKLQQCEDINDEELLNQMKLLFTPTP